MSNILTDGKGNGIPQFQKGTGEFAPLLGDKAPYSQILDANGNLLFTNVNPAAVQVTSLPLKENYMRKSNETKPGVEDGVEDGDSLLLVDTRQIFKFYQGEWWEL